MLRTVLAIVVLPSSLALAPIASSLHTQKDTQLRLRLGQVLRALDAVAPRRALDAVMAKKKKGTQVVFLEDFDKYKKGELVEVTTGYAIMLKGKGVASSDKSMIADVQKQAAEEAAIEAADKKKAADAAAVIYKKAMDTKETILKAPLNMFVTLKGGKITEGTSAEIIADFIKEKTGVAVDPDSITAPDMKGKELEGTDEKGKAQGKFTATVSLHPQVKVDMPITVRERENQYSFGSV
jgi:ribosomal protein L9